MFLSPKINRRILILPYHSNWPIQIFIFQIWPRLKPKFHSWRRRSERWKIIRHKFCQKGQTHFGTISPWPYHLVDVSRNFILTVIVAKLYNLFDFIIDNFKSLQFFEGVSYPDYINDLIWLNWVIDVFQRRTKSYAKDSQTKKKH